MTTITQRLRNHFYPVERPDCFADLIEEESNSGATEMLVFGAGSGLHEPDLRRSGRRVTGVDVDNAIQLNQQLDRKVCYDGQKLPFDDNSFDACTCLWVIEHLPRPADTFRDIARVLRPGGRFIFRTSNVSFYAYRLAQLIPNSLHGRIVKFATGREEQDTFPTCYRANTRESLRALLGRSGFREDVLSVSCGSPEYLGFSPITFLLGVAYERTVNASPRLEDFRQIIDARFIKDA